MKLSFEQIKSITFGAHKIEKEGEVISFFKCTERQSEAWFALSETLGTRSLTTTGIRLDFHTTSKTMRIKTASGKRYDILINGVIRTQLSSGCPDKSEAIDATLDLAHPSGRTPEMIRVTVVFPSHSIGKLVSVELEDGAVIIPHKYDRKFLFIGDSITQGYNSSFDSLSYAWQTSLYFNAESIINGIGGAFYDITTCDMPNFDPELVILAYGTNDAFRYKTNYDEMHRQVKGYQDFIKENYPGKKIVVISPIFRADESFRPHGEWFDEKRRMVEDEAKAHGFYLIDGLTLFPANPAFFRDTYTHPNDIGFAVYAHNLTRELEKILAD